MDHLKLWVTIKLGITKLNYLKCLSAAYLYWLVTSLPEYQTFCFPKGRGGEGVLASSDALRIKNLFEMVSLRKYIIEIFILEIQMHHIDQLIWIKFQATGSLTKMVTWYLILPKLLMNLRWQIQKIFWQKTMKYRIFSPPPREYSSTLFSLCQNSAPQKSQATLLNCDNTVKKREKFFDEKL